MIAEVISVACLVLATVMYLMTRRYYRRMVVEHAEFMREYPPPVVSEQVAETDQARLLLDDPRDTSDA